MADEKKVVSTLGMSDEDFLKLDPSTFAAQAEEVQEVDETTEVSETNDQADKVVVETPAVDEETSVEQTEEETETTDEAIDDTAGQVADVQAGKSAKSTTNATAADKADDAKVDDKVEFDYKTAYEKLTAPFKANGKEIQVKGVEDAVALMQMGANYNKKMAGLKPSMKILKLLENNGLLDEAKLGFLIDLDKRNPEAINKLVKDSGIDPMDLSADNASAYRPGTYTVDEREMELDAVLKDLEDTPAYARTLEVVGSKWDGASKQAIAAQPEVLRILNDHMDRGIYDRIATRMESERVFGRLKGLSDLDAYKQVGDAIQAEGGFADLGHQKQNVPAQSVVAKPKPNKIDEAKLKEKKRAASSTKAVMSGAAKPEFSPLALSDEEFMKQAQAKFM